MHKPERTNRLERPVELVISQQPVDYEEAVAFMEAHVQLINEGKAQERVWLLEHPPLYTGGTSAKEGDLLQPDRFPVYKTKRGGQFTYHGPGQRVIYVMLNLAERQKDVRLYVQDLERFVINTLERFNVTGVIRDGRVGVWVNRTQSGGPQRDDKIAAIGVRIKRWITYHGIGLNIEPDLEHFTGITPCGIAEQSLGVTSMVDLGLPVTMEEVDAVLIEEFEKIFSPPRQISSENALRS